jgi:hypothetical protein
MISLTKAIPQSVYYAWKDMTYWSIQTLNKYIDFVKYFTIYYLEQFFIGRTRSNFYHVMKKSPSYENLK